MTNLNFHLFKKLLSGGVCLLLFIVNGPLAYSNETNIWSSRRAFSDQIRRNGAEGETAGSPEERILLAQMPKARPLDFGRDFNSTIDKNVQTPKEPFSIGPKTGDWLGKLVLPYGSVREVYLSPDTKAPFIVHIQDAHGIEEAQRNISSMIGQLAQEPGISLVGLEGASGSFSLKPYRDYPDASITKDIADLFLKKGLIAGPEYAGLTLPKSPDFFGAEDQSLYTANVKALKDAYKGKQAAQETLAGLQRAAEKLKEVSFSEDLKTFDRHFNNYHSDKEKLAPYARYILETHQTLQNLRFDTKKTHPLPAVPTRHFLLAQSRAGEGENFRPEQLGLLVLALDEEESLDFARVEWERKQLVERLVGKLSAGQIQDLVAKSVDYRAGRMGYGDYHHQLKKLCVAHGIKFSEWPQLNRYLSYVLLADKIDRNELLNEMEALDRSIPERLARNEKERQLVAVTFDLSLLAKLLRHEMSVADWTAYEARMGEIHRLAARLTALDSSVKVKGLTPETLKPYEDFCSYASRRNNALTDNLLRQMADTKGKSAVLVAGGFHTEGLSALLRKKRVSYVVVTPKITAFPKDNDYLDVMANDPLPLEQQLAGDRIYLSKPVASANPNNATPKAITAIQGVTQNGAAFYEYATGLAITNNPKLGDPVGNPIALGKRFLYIVKNYTREPLLFEYSKKLWGVLKAWGRMAPTMTEDGLLAVGALGAMFSPIYPLTSLSVLLYLHRGNFERIFAHEGPKKNKIAELAQVIGGLTLLQFLWFIPAMEIVAQGFTPTGLAWALSLGSIHFIQSQMAGRLGWQRWTSDLLDPPDVSPPLTPHQLLTSERRSRNDALAKYTRGRRTVLYLGGGFDLNNVLTTFQEATRIVMVGKGYKDLVGESVANAMKKQIPERIIDQYYLHEYQTMSLQSGFVGSVIVEKGPQEFYLAKELLALGVNPETVSDAETRTAIRFRMPKTFWGEAREVTVEFRNNDFSPDQSIHLNLGPTPFDGVYSKAIHDMGHIFSEILESIAPHLTPSTTLVVNQKPEGTEPVLPGFSVQHEHSEGDMKWNYGNFFGAYSLTKQNPSPEVTAHALPQTSTTPPIRYRLLTKERLERNRMIAQHTGGVTSVLYLAAGFDLNNVLTTFPNAKEVLMVGRNYQVITAHEIKDAMSKGIFSKAALEYLDVVIANGFGTTLAVENKQNQISILVLELMALGVEPSSIGGDPHRAGFRFSLPQPGKEAREIFVEFRNAQLGPSSPSNRFATSVNFGDRLFDGVYFKAGEQLARDFPIVLRQVIGSLRPHTVLVLNNLHGYVSDDPNEKWSLEVPGFQTTYIRSYFSQDPAYGNRLNVYNLDKDQNHDTTDRVQGVSWNLSPYTPFTLIAGILLVGTLFDFISLWSTPATGLLGFPWTGDSSLALFSLGMVFQNRELPQLLPPPLIKRTHLKNKFIRLRILLEERLAGLGTSPQPIKVLFVSESGKVARRAATYSRFGVQMNHALPRYRLVDSTRAPPVFDRINQLGGSAQASDFPAVVFQSSTASEFKEFSSENFSPDFVIFLKEKGASARPRSQDAEEGEEKTEFIEISEDKTAHLLTSLTETFSGMNRGRPLAVNNRNNFDLSTDQKEESPISSTVYPRIKTWGAQLYDDLVAGPVRETDRLISLDLRSFINLHRVGSLQKQSSLALGWVGLGFIASVSVALMAAAPYSVLLSAGVSPQLAIILSLGVAGVGAVLFPTWAMGATLLGNMGQNALARLLNPLLHFLGLPELVVLNLRNSISSSVKSWRETLGERISAPTRTSEGAFFIVKDMGKGEISKEVKKIVGEKKDRLKYKLTETDRQIAAELTEEYTNVLRPAIRQFFQREGLIPEFKREGRMLKTKRVDGTPFMKVIEQHPSFVTTEWIERTQNLCQGAINVAKMALAHYEKTHAPVPGWTILVDEWNLNNFYIDGKGNLMSWIDPIVTEPPERTKIDTEKVSPYRIPFRSFKRKMVAVGVALPLLETVVLFGVRTLLAFLGEDPLGGVFLLFMGSLFATGHMVYRSIKDEPYTGGEVLWWMTGGLLFTYLLGGENGFAISFAVHAIVNSALVILKFGKLDKPFPVFSAWAKKIPYFSIVSGEQKKRNSERVAPDHRGDDILDIITGTSDPTEQMALNSVVETLTMKGRYRASNLKLQDSGVKGAYWTSEELREALAGFGKGQAAEALSGPEAHSNALEVMAGLMVQNGEGPGVRMVLDLMNFNSWDREAQETAKAMVAGLTKSRQPVLMLRDGVGNTDDLLNELGLELNRAQRDLIDTQQAGMGYSMSKILSDYDARTRGKGVSLASTVLVQDDKSIVMDLSGYKLQTYSNLSQAVQNALEVVVAVLRSA